MGWDCRCGPATAAVALATCWGAFFFLLFLGAASPSAAGRLRCVSTYVPFILATASESVLEYWMRIGLS
uniref:Putative secreted protein n=1 Tax=Ixodes ricinus TaxID=34613 RepID=A0A6B0U8I6_IXORI